MTTAKKQLGQHWLVNPQSLEHIVEFADLDKTDTVLEIGPGKGHLTELLLDEGVSLIAVEADADLIGGLNSRFSARFKLINDDILNFDLSSLPKDYVVVANIPYYLTGKIIRFFIDAANQPSKLVLLLQKEVALRLAAQPGQLSLLGLAVQIHYSVDLGRVIEASDFQPSPKVDSQTVRLVALDRPRIIAKEDFWRLAKAGFANRRKTLVNSLFAGLQIPKKDLKSVLVEIGLKDNIRAQELTIANWQELYNKLHNKL